MLRIRFSAKDPVVVPPGGTIEVTDDKGRLSAIISQQLDGSVAVILPPDKRIDHHALLYGMHLAPTHIHPQNNPQNDG